MYRIVSYRYSPSEYSSSCGMLCRDGSEGADFSWGGEVMRDGGGGRNSLSASDGCGIYGT